VISELYKMHISISISAAPKRCDKATDQWNGSMSRTEGADRCPLTEHGTTDVLNPPVGRALHGSPAVPYRLPLATLRGGTREQSVRSKPFRRSGGGLRTEIKRCKLFLFQICKLIYFGTV
jgi:hypothetical protein